MYFRVELTHRSGALIPPDKRRREDWLFGSVTMGCYGKQYRMVNALELTPPRVTYKAPIAWLYKPEFIALSGRSITFSGLEKATFDGKTAWVQQCWACVYADDGEFTRWAKSLSKIPEWAAFFV